MINVSEINNIESNRKKNKKELYKKIYEQFSRKIRCTVELGGKYVFLRVPSVVFGFPTFDRSHACVYLRRQLELAGFNVQSMSEIDLCVHGLHNGKRKHQQHRVTMVIYLPLSISKRWQINTEMVRSTFNYFCILL